MVTDHKPLVTICHKPLHTAPPRLQRILLKIQGYGYQIQYRPGTEMILADALSRFPNPQNNGEIPLDLRVDNVDICLVNFAMGKRLARNTVYWPNINKDIEEICKSCATCQEYQDGNRKEPLQPYPLPSRPWQSISSDLFSIGDKSFLLIVDCYSRYPLEVEFKSVPASHAVTEGTKHYCAMLGRPDSIVSDNGTQYTGAAYQEFVAQ